MQTVKENGQEVTSVSTYTEFTHGWQSFFSAGHIFRIETSIGLADSLYIFTIDGVRFEDLPREPLKTDNRPALKTSTSSRGGGRISAGTAGSPRPQVDPFDSSDPFSSSGFGSDKPTSQSSFDPFEDDVIKPKAPVSARKAVATPEQPKKTPTSAAKPTPTPITPSVPLFDGFDDAPKVTAKQDYLSDLASLSVSSSAPSKDIFAQVNDPFAPKAVIINTPQNTHPIATSNKPESATQLVLDDATRSLVSFDLNKAPTTTHGTIGASAAQTRKDEYTRNLPLNSLLGAQAPRQAVMPVDPLSVAPQAPPMRVLSASEAISVMGSRPMPPPGYGPPPGYPQQGYGGYPQQQQLGFPANAMQPGPTPMQAGRPNMAPPPVSYGSYGKPVPAGDKPSTSSLDSLNWKM